MIVGFYAVPPASYADPERACEVAARSAQVASVSVNSRAVGDVLDALLSTCLAPLVAAADTAVRVAYIPAADFLQLAAQAATLRTQRATDLAIVAIGDEIDEALSEVRWRGTDLLVVAR